MLKSKRSKGQREKIISVAQKLFHEKGYDNTTIQDIVDGLGGMTKGVIYHYFSSKEEIMQSVMSRYADPPKNQLSQQEKPQEKIGLEKLREKMLTSLADTEKLIRLFSAKALMKSPRIIGEVYLACLKRSSQVQVFIDEGIKDGSIVTEYPEELAEFISLIVDMGFVLNFPRCSRDEFERRVLFLKNMFQRIDVPLFTDEMLESILHLYDHIGAQK